MSTPLFIALAGLILAGVAALVLALRRGRDEPQASAPARSAAFGDLSGESLWNAMSGSLPPGWDEASLDVARARYEAILRRHVAEVFDAGRQDGRTGNRSPVGSSHRVTTLRESIDSWIPQSHADTIYGAGFRCAKAAPGEFPEIRQALDAACTALFQAVRIKLARPMSRELMPIETEPAGRPQAEPDAAASGRPGASAPESPAAAETEAR